jgi:hypothetical protein
MRARLLFHRRKTSQNFNRYGTLIPHTRSPRPFVVTVVGTTFHGASMLRAGLA